MAHDYIEEMLSWSKQWHPMAWWVDSKSKTWKPTNGKLHDDVISVELMYQWSKGKDKVTMLSKLQWVSGQIKRDGWARKMIE